MPRFLQVLLAALSFGTRFRGPVKPAEPALYSRALALQPFAGLLVGVIAAVPTLFVSANFRHDGKNHRSMVQGCLIDTGRRKFGSIIGENVHTGIHTAIYPGRKIWADVQTRPGDVVQLDLMK